MTSPDSAATPPIPPAPTVPTYGEYASPEHAEAARSAQQAPQYGQYGQPQYQQQPYAPQPYNPNGPNAWGAGPRPVRVADMVVSIALLFFGGISTIIAIVNSLTIDVQLQTIYDSEGISGTYASGSGGAIAAAVIVISHVVLLALAIIFTIVLVRKRRLSFWLPLTTGAVAAVIYWVTFVVLVMSDPAILEFLSNQ